MNLENQTQIKKNYKSRIKRIKFKQFKISFKNCIIHFWSEFNQIKSKIQSN